jgi:hypothetical protein
MDRQSLDISGDLAEKNDEVSTSGDRSDFPFLISTISDRKTNFRESAEDKTGFSLLTEVRVKIMLPSFAFLPQEIVIWLTMQMAIMQ